MTGIRFENYPNFNHAIPFIKHGTNLTKVRLEYHESKNAIDLFALNRERAKLRAKKVTLYVNEAVYMATLWAMREIDLECIKIKRIASPDSSEVRDSFTFGANVL